LKSRLSLFNVILAQNVDNAPVHEHPLRSFIP
jgi:hypothetical protein